ncbi:MAG TPA: LysR family transcriptional regulator [Usitatibacter sp.]|jgi:DNA-binding transcriptional LysR family regulator|nr:LysR family transcriptional regulator [Usitatibacter sp.]
MDTTTLAFAPARETQPLALTRKRYFLHGLLPQLIAFEACIRHGSVTQAARELRLAQPTVSCMLRKLSITFGGPLTTRRAGRIEPTARGEEVLELSGNMLAVLDHFDSRERSPARIGAGVPLPVL